MSSKSLPGSKRKANDDTEQPTHKKVRHRVSYSCAECHRRKQKCNRQMPCSHCVARKVPELCKAYIPGKSDVDLHVRVARLEQIIELALPQYPNFERLVEPRDAFSSPDGHSNGSDDDREGHEALRTVVQSHFLEQSKHNSFSSMFEDVPPPAARRLRSLVIDCGFSPQILSDLVKQLPDENLSRALVDHYFTVINYTRYPLYEPLFRASYQSICLNGHNLQPSDIRFLPLLFVVLALSMRLSPEHIENSDQMRRLTSLRYYWSSRRALLIASAIQTNSLEIILARLLGARFNIFDRRVTESWNEIGAAVRTAQALGLHRDPSKLELDTLQTEYRRRIWAYVYHADRAVAFITGIPKSISDSYTSTRAPLNIHDTSLESYSYPQNPEPLSNPTPITFAILRHGLAGVMGRVAHHFQQVQGQGSYSEVLALDEELKKFITSLPPCFASTNPDTSFDESQPYVPVHRYLLLTEVMFYRIALHRPYFLRRLGGNTFDSSRQACIESAKHDSEIRQNFYKNASREAIAASGGMFRAFQSTMICGIALIIDPNRDDAQEMYTILDNFLRTTPETVGRGIDAATQREMKIIKFLRSKVVKESGKALPPPNIAETEENILSNSQSGPQSLGFPQSATRQPTPSSNTDFYSTLTPNEPAGFPSGVISQPSSSSYPGSDNWARLDGGQSDPTAWNYDYASFADDHTFQANEQWAGGSDIVPDIMETMFNGDTNLSEGTGEWSYWEALVNQLRIGGQP